jgi:hypothetical protein
MALFAELDNNNNVLNILVSSDTRVQANGGHQSQQAADDFASYTPHSYNGVKWVESSTDGSFRGKVASINGTYDEANDRFLDQKLYASWILDENNDWKAPVDAPARSVDAEGNYDYSIIYVWDEDNQQWNIQS